MIKIAAVYIHRAYTYCRCIFKAPYRVTDDVSVLEVLSPLRSRLCRSGLLRVCRAEPELQAERHLGTTRKRRAPGWPHHVCPK